MLGYCVVSAARRGDEVDGRNERDYLLITSKVERLMLCALLAQLATQLSSCGYLR